MSRLIRFAEAVRAATAGLIEDGRRRMSALVDQAIEALRDVLADPEAPAGAKVSAAREVLDRAYGRAPATIEHSGSITDQPEKITLEIIPAGTRRDETPREAA